MLAMSMIITRRIRPPPLHRFFIFLLFLHVAQAPLQPFVLWGKRHAKHYDFANVAAAAAAAVSFQLALQTPRGSELLMRPLRSMFINRKARRPKKRPRRFSTVLKFQIVRRSFLVLKKLSNNFSIIFRSQMGFVFQFESNLKEEKKQIAGPELVIYIVCLLYTSDAADE